MGKKTSGIRITREEREAAISKFADLMAAGAFQPKRPRRRTTPASATVAQLCGIDDPGLGTNKYLINLEPDFQRGFVWGPDREDALINTILEEGYIPPVVVGRVQGRDDWVCVDGGNRIGTIKRFVSGNRAISGLFIREDSSVSLDPTKPVNKFVGKRFKELDEDIRNKILDFKIQVIEEVVQNQSALSDIFVRLNCGGVDMDFGQILLAKYRQTEIGSAIVRFLDTEAAKSLVPSSRLKKRGNRVNSAGFTKCAEYIATATDFMGFAGKAGTDRFLWEKSSISKPEAIQIVFRFRKALEAFNRFFGDFEFESLRYEKTVPRFVKVRLGEQDRVKAAVVSLLYGMDNMDSVQSRSKEIGMRMVEKLNSVGASTSVLLDLLTVQTTIPGRREQAISQIRECFTA